MQVEVKHWSDHSQGKCSETVSWEGSISLWTAGIHVCSEVICIKLKNADHIPGNKIWHQGSFILKFYTVNLRSWSTHASTPSSSGGRGLLGCLLSKCCLKVLGSGICDLQTAHVNTNAAFAAVFWSWPLDFLISACFLAFFCWDWIFWCPRAMLADEKRRQLLAC